jgi:dipeptidyl aminopeptidase/acylaminoacyl peptidase
VPQSPRPIAPDDIARIVTASDAQLSPDGRLVAYTRTETDLEHDEYRSAIWTVPTDGGDPVRITRSSGRDSAPRWSPDGRLLAFLSDRDGRPAQLYLLPMSGGEPSRLTFLPGGAGPAVWAPGGSRLAFCARVAKDAVPSDRDARERWNQRPRVVTRAQYKTDGAGYTFDGTAQIFVAALGGGVAQRTIVDAEHLTPAWSPDGSRLAFARARTGAADYSLFDLWVMDADGHNARRLTDAVGRVVAPAWSPDGRSLAFYGHDAQEAGLGDAMVRVWVTPASGGPARAITATYHRGIALARPPEATTPPIWSADGRTVAVPIADAGNVHVARVSVQDGTVRSIVAGERQVQGWSVAAGRVGFCATEWHVPSDVYTCREDGAEERRLTQLNAAWLSTVALPRVERRTFASPHGGELDGWVVHPLDGRRPAPLLVEIHGGPHSYHGNAFPAGSLHVFALAARGWAVLELNPTGSGSYDKAFAHGIRGRWGEHDLPEQFAAVDALVSSGVADAARLAVSGYSYGGFMTAWTITHSDRFKSAIVGAPVVNFESFHGTSDIGPWFGPWELRGDLVAHRETYRRLSPINYVERVVTPTLIVHGEADDRCPIAQGEELYIGLATAGRVPVEFVRYPGQSHAFRGSGRPTHRIDVVRRVVDWAERHTTGTA